MYLSGNEVLYIGDKKITKQLITQLASKMPAELQMPGYVGNVSYTNENVNISGTPFNDVIKFSRDDDRDYYREQGAMRRWQQQKDSNDNLTEEQHDAMATLASVRHEIHISDFWNLRDQQDAEDMLDEMNDILSKVGLPKIYYVSKGFDFVDVPTRESWGNFWGRHLQRQIKKGNLVRIKNNTVISESTSLIKADYNNSVAEDKISQSSDNVNNKNDIKLSRSTDSDGNTLTEAQHIKEHHRMSKT